MTKCPFCQYDNEDGALFCEQCKSDLGMAPPEAVGADEVPMAAFMEDLPGHDIPMAAVVAEPVEAMPVEENPFDFGGSNPAAPEAAPVETIPAAKALAEAVPVAPPMAVPVGAASPPPVPMATPVAPSAAPPPTSESERLAPDVQPKLVVLRGQRINVEFPLYEGHNFIGRADEKPVDIDLEDQEPPDRIWSSRQHAVITFEEGKLVIEDLNSANGTFVNRSRIHPGQKRPLKISDIIQIGTVQLKVKT
jgi:hypothetical protein